MKRRCSVSGQYIGSYSGADYSEKEGKKFKRRVKKAIGG
jgi:hypothetical protein